MLKDFYTDIIARIDTLVKAKQIPNPNTGPGEPEFITTYVPVIQQKGWWNEQWAFEKQNNPYKFPCCFVEFVAFPWQQLGNKVQQADAVVNIHLGFSELDENNVDHLDIIESLNYVLTGFQGSNFGTWTRTNLVLDHNHDKLITAELTYRMRVQDDTAKRPLVVKNGDLYELIIDYPRPMKPGQFHQGGLIAYVDETGIHGFITNTALEVAGKKWDEDFHTVAGSNYRNIGWGKKNTELIVDLLGECDCAASYCNSLESQGYDDWYLPDYEELKQLAKQGFLADERYWSSTEDANDTDSAYYWDPLSHKMSTVEKFEEMRVIPIRYF